MIPGTGQLGQPQQLATERLQTNDTMVYEALTARFGGGVTFNELKSIALILAQTAGVTSPSRYERRCFSNLAKWCSSHWVEISPFLPFIHLRDENDIDVKLHYELHEREQLALKIMRLMSND
jgi:hypothetical protein